MILSSLFAPVAVCVHGCTRCLVLETPALLMTSAGHWGVFEIIASGTRARDAFKIEIRIVIDTHSTQISPDVTYPRTRDT
jgi:hypothetical protein